MIRHQNSQLKHQRAGRYIPGSDFPASRQLIREAQQSKQPVCNEISQLPSVKGEAKQ